MPSNRSIKLTSIIFINIVLGILIARLLWFHVDFDLIISESMSLDRSSIILSVALGILLYLFYGLRMALLLDIKLISSTQIVIMGFGLNAFLPFRLGDVLKVFFAKHFFKIDLTKSSFATIIEKGMDLAVISCLASTFIFGIVRYYVVVFLFMVIIVFLFINSKNNLIYKTHNQLLKYFINIVQKMFEKHKHIKIIFYTVSIWSLTCLVFYLFFNMNMISGGMFTVFDAITLLIFTTLSLAIPSMPASIGLFESGIVYYLTHNFQFSSEKAVAYAVIFHLIMTLPQIICTVLILLANLLIANPLRPVPNEI